MKFFGGGLSNILDQHYRTGPSTNHRAKFCDGRPTHLGDFALNKKFVTKHKQLKNFGQSPT